MPPTIIPYVPQNITVHLGYPSSDAQNVVVSFQDYIKNVASSEIYPTWDESAIIANVYAQISYALNRVYIEFYPSRGYNFHITNSTAVDQKFIYGRNIFENIDRIVSGIFNNYIRTIGVLEPLAAKYCNGTTVTCEGLSQWGSEYLARQGYSSMDILYNYYGNNIELVVDAPIKNITRSYPGYPIRVGDRGENVLVIQTQLNRISLNYPAIPKVYPKDGIFGPQTERAVIKFQQIFGLEADGIVGKATWYKLINLYTGITRLAELDSEGQRIFGIDLQYPDAISIGNKGEKVTILQFFLSVIASVNPFIPSVPITGEFGDDTQNAVIEFQKNAGLEQDGIVGEKTWNALYDEFKGVVDVVFLDGSRLFVTTQTYPGELSYGSSGESVRTLQQYLNTIALANPELSAVPVTGEFGNQTRQVVTEYQRAFGLPVTGSVDKDTWDSIAETYKNVVSSTLTQPRQFPGYTIKLGDKDENTVGV